MSESLREPVQAQPGEADTDPDRLADQVRQVVAAVCRVDAATVGEDDDFAEDLGVDSLAKLELVVQIERAFGVRLDDEQAAALGSVADVVTQLTSHRAH